MTKAELDKMVDAYCLTERQWPRHFRIQHAEYRKTLSVSDDERRFWTTVLKRMKD